MQLNTQARGLLATVIMKHGEKVLNGCVDKVDIEILKTFAQRKLSTVIFQNQE